MKFFSQKNKKLIPLLVLVLALGIILPFHFVHAGFWDVVPAILLSFLFFTINIFVSIFLLISTPLIGASGALLQWVTSGNFTTYGFTNNEIIETGLDITLPFANMFFILILVVIAFATILRVQNYALQKLLPTFIIIALLVNFAPVFCGFIVDFSNLLTRFFTDNIGSFSGMDLSMDSIKEMWWPGFSEVLSLLIHPTDLAEHLVSSFALGLSQTIYNFIASLVLLMFTGLFMLRYIMIWVLVIIAPVCLACYILPITKGAWNWWWNQFFQWAIIGIVGGFFLFLGAYVMANMGDLVNMDNLSEELSSTINEELPSTTDSDWLTTIVNTMIPKAVPIAFLLIGFFLSIKAGPMGAAVITGGAVALYAGMKKHFAEATKAEITPRLEKRLKTREIAQGLSRGLEKVPFVRETMATPLREYAEGKKDNIKAGEEIGKNLSPIRRAEMFWSNALADPYKNIGLLSADPSDIQAFIDEGKRRGMTDEEINKKLNDSLVLAGQVHDPTLKKMIKGDLRLAKLSAAQKRIGADQTNRQKEVDAEDNPELASIRLWMKEELKPENIKDVADKAFEDPDVQDALLRYGRLEHFINIAHQKPKIQKTIQERIDRILQQGGKLGVLDDMIKDPRTIKRLENAGWRFPLSPGAAMKIKPSPEKIIQEMAENPPGEVPELDEATRQQLQKKQSKKGQPPPSNKEGQPEPNPETVSTAPSETPESSNRSSDESPPS